MSVGLAISLVAVGYGVTGVRYPGSGSSPAGVSSGGEAPPDHSNPPPGGNSAHPADARIRTNTTATENGLYTLVTVEGLCKGVFMLLSLDSPINIIHLAYIQPEENTRNPSQWYRILT
ncbi:MAG: hypothetical protein WC138_08985 [Methanoculleus sp.]